MSEEGYDTEIKVLVTGFGEFLDVKVNPSWEIVSGLPSTIYHNWINIRVITEPEPRFVYYASLEWVWRKGGGGDVPVVFLHVPPLPTKDDVARGEKVTMALIRAMTETVKK